MAPWRVERTEGPHTKTVLGAWQQFAIMWLEPASLPQYPPQKNPQDSRQYVSELLLQATNLVGEPSTIAYAKKKDITQIYDMYCVYILVHAPRSRSPPPHGMLLVLGLALVPVLILVLVLVLVLGLVLVMLVLVFVIGGGGSTM